MKEEKREGKEDSLDLLTERNFLATPLQKSMYYLCRVYTRRSSRRSVAATIAAIEQAIVPATRLRIVAAMQIISIKNKLDFWGLDGHNNVCFTAYGSQWLD